MPLNTTSEKLENVPCRLNVGNIGTVMYHAFTAAQKRRREYRQGAVFRTLNIYFPKQRIFALYTYMRHSGTPLKQNFNYSLFKGVSSRYICIKRKQRDTIFKCRLTNRTFFYESNRKN